MGTLLFLFRRLDIFKYVCYNYLYIECVLPLECFLAEEIALRQSTDVLLFRCVGLFDGDFDPAFADYKERVAPCALPDNIVSVGIEGLFQHVRYFDQCVLWVVLEDRYTKIQHTKLKRASGLYYYFKNNSIYLVCIK